MPPFVMPPVLFILSVVLFSLHTLSSSDATDTISTGQVLAGNDKLISSNGKFALGFFHTGSESYNTSMNWYLGIWFNKVPKLIPVWVANRQNPIIDPTISELAVSSDGNLVILNKVTKTKIWSSSQIDNRITRNYTVAVLQNNGNLVIQNASNASNVLWQSFDYPTDALLPGAKAGRNKITGLHYSRTSKKNLIDLAPGFYCSELDRTSVRQFITKLCNSSVVYWSTGNWNGKYFSFLPGMADEIQSRNIYDYKFVDNDEEEYFMYTVKDDTLITFNLLDVTGQTKQLIWLERQQDWLAVDTHPKAQCEVYGVCGPFTICNDNIFPLCSCMKGFSIRSPKDWELGDQTRGCMRNIALDCKSKQSSTTSSTDKFYSISSVILPSNANIIEDATSVDKCAQACLNHCSCTAYSYGTRCTIWHNVLLNVIKQQQYNDAISTNNEILYLRLAAKEVQSWRHVRREIIVCVSVAALSAFFLLLLIICTNRRKSSGSIFNNIQGGSGIIAFKYKDLRCATKKFSDKLGGGGFGSVFKGFLHHSSTAIAVKRLDGARQGEKQFKAEVSSIGIIQHINLVKLIGFCCEGNRRLLVYEHMPNGSLDVHLFQSNGTVLKWSTRYQISLGIAKGLAYLHHGCRECIIHCDIKPQNILLDASFVPKVADFGMAKFVGRDFSRVLTTVRGTIGYLAPEWISGVAITPKVDVYSYGMMMLEIVSGRRNSQENCTSNGDHNAYFPVKVLSKLLEGDIESLVDQELYVDVNLEEVERVCKLACWCIQDNEFDRPTMGEVVQILEGVLGLDTPPIPRLIQSFFRSSKSARSTTY